MTLQALISASPALAWQVNVTSSFVSFPPSTYRCYSFSSSTLPSAIGRLEKLHVVSATQERSALPEAGLALQLFEELKKDEFLVPIAPHVSLARQHYCDPVESAVNEQINVEYTASYAYHALYAYFDRDNVALKGFARFFQKSSEEERHHAEKLMQYQNKRGGKVKLLEIKAVPSEFEHVEKGDALHAMELALSLEKLTNERLLGLRNIGEKNNDPHLVDFVESEFLTEQVESIKNISDYVTQLRMIGKGLGVWEFDQRVLGGGD